jgi:hypothetical protein
MEEQTSARPAMAGDLMTASSEVEEAYDAPFGTFLSPDSPMLAACLVRPGFRRPSLSALATGGEAIPLSHDWQRAH